MKITANQRVEVELDEHEQKRITRAYLMRRFGFADDHDTLHFVNDNGDLILSQTVYNGSHSSDHEIVVRRATKQDKVVLDILKALR